MATKKREIKLPKTKFFWVYYIIALVLGTLGTFLLPVWADKNVFWSSWSSGALSIILTIILAAYVVIYLTRLIKSKVEGVMRTLHIFELAFLIVLTVLSVISLFGALDFVGPCFVFGAIFWLRGCFFIIKAYLFKHTKKEGDYPVYVLALAIALVSVGPVLMVRPFSGSGFMWIVSVAVLVAALLSLVMGFVAIPSKSAAPAVKTSAAAKSSSAKTSAASVKTSAPAAKESPAPEKDDGAKSKTEEDKGSNA